MRHSTRPIAAKPETRVDLHKMKALDIVLIALIVAGSVGALLGARSVRRDFVAAEKQVVVYHDGVMAATFAMSADREIVLLEGKMVLQILDKRVRVKRSHCVRQFCARRGWALYEGETIVCVPQKTVIEITSDASPAVDAVIY